MKYIFTADLHIHEYKNDDEYTDDGISLKLSELLNCFRQVCDYAIKNSITTIIIGGDIIHHKNTIHSRPFVKFSKILSEYKNLKFIIYPGNHDRVGNSDESAVDLLSNHDNVTCINKTTILNNITIIPDSNHLYEDVAQSAPNDILCSHFPLSEAKTDTGMEIATRFKKSELKKYKRVYIGDYHSHQCIDGFIYYPGSLIPTNRSETSPKGFIIFDSESLETEFIELSGYRKYVEIMLDENSNPEEIRNIIQSSHESGDKVTIKKKIENIDSEMVKSLDGMTVIDLYEKEYIMRGITTGMGLDEQLDKYIEIKSIPESDIPRYKSVWNDVKLRL